ncbi:MAG: PDZ domain-containing protein [Armatimonadetes bacterium]|nr:PDZ domain-containing protein [Armatimonadota bacterium]
MTVLLGFGLNDVEYVTILINPPASKDSIMLLKMQTVSLSILTLVAISILNPIHLHAATPEAPPALNKTSQSMDKVAQDFLDEVFTFVQENAVFRHRLNWKRLRREVFLMAAGARGPADTYPSIRHLVASLEDNRHSAFFPALPPVPPPPSPETTDKGKPETSRKQGGIGAFSLFPSGIVYEVLAGSPAERAGLRIGDKITALNGRPTSAWVRDPFARAFFGPMVESNEPPDSDAVVSITYQRPGGAGDLKSQMLMIPFGSYSKDRIPIARRFPSEIGYVEAPMILGQTQQAMTRYAEAMQQAIRAVDMGEPGEAPVRKWIIDVRRNQGGNSWPILAGLGPLIGEGVIGGTDGRKVERDETRYEKGQAKLNDEVIAQVASPYRLRAGKKIFVAVLTGSMTASAGEAVVLWFRGLPNVRTFGESTYGVPTANIGHRFSDGSGMNLTVSVGVDRKGRNYAGPIPPDVPVMTEWTAYGTEADPAVAAAINWLQTRK